MRTRSGFAWAGLRTVAGIGIEAVAEAGYRALARDKASKGLGLRFRLELEPGQGIRVGRERSWAGAGARGWS